MMLYMTRAREFSREDALEQLATVFVAQGFNGCSVADMEAATGLGRQSIYNCFGDKRDAYLAAIEFSTGRFVQQLGNLDELPSGAQAIHQFFSRLAALCSSDYPLDHGCIVSNGLLENSQDAHMQEKLVGCWQNTQQFLQGHIKRGQADQSIASTLPASVIADVLMTGMSGLRVAARAGCGPARLKKMVVAMLRILEA
jgi:TetR/AcrR family transcriptional regulator, transcriptional repressor for nem operon